MSAETLRRAATAIRDEWGGTRGGAWSKVQAFHLAVADWLDGVAQRWDFPALAPNDADHALTVARTYLGEDE